uniref:Uncharacterized protein n=1 Tax=Oryza nivara TaxID=4536 RepID=A0A0E0H109_ORYNI
MVGTIQNLRNHSAADVTKFPVYSTTSTISGLSHRLRNDMPAKNRMLAEACMVFDAIPVRNYVSWAALFTVYACCGRVAEARELMPERNDVSWNMMILGKLFPPLLFRRRSFEGTFPPIQNLLRPFRCLLLRRFCSLGPPQRHAAGDVFQSNTAINEHFRAGRVAAARRVFDEMSERNVFTWNCMVSGLIRNRMLAEARKVFDAMPVRNSVSWAALLTGYARCGRVAEARELFNRIPDRNVVSWNAMVSGYARNGMVKRARELFDMMPWRDDVSWLTMISGYIKRKHVREARELFDSMPSPPTSVCNALLSGYVELGYMRAAEVLFGQMQTRNPVSWNVMITGYARAGSMGIAQRLFDEMPEKDVLSRTAIMRGYLQNGSVDAAWKVFKDMPHRDTVAWNTMMDGFVQNDRLDDALKLFSEMPDRDQISWNAILQGYVQQGDMDSANAWFRRAPNKDAISWNTLISGYKDEGALSLLSEMIRGGLKPDQATLSVVISICASLVSLGCGKMVHLWAIKTGFEHDALVMSSLISMYSKCGLISEASQVFELILQRDTVTWNAMIATYAYHGLADEALKVFDMMTKAGFRPDHATFLSILSACAHKGYLYEGCYHFRSMQEDWNLVPRSDHYSCMVDLLGRSGFIHQAYDFTRRIPSDHRTTAWETLFSACNSHGEIQLGEIIARNVLKARPSDGGMYTLLSNIYAAKEMWSSAASVRGFMKERGLKKETGCSWIELKGEVVTFSSNDSNHPLIEQICQEVDSISVMIEEAT